jgi:hypothetical protein
MTEARGHRRYFRRGLKSQSLRYQTTFCHSHLDPAIRPTPHRIGYLEFPSSMFSYGFTGFTPLKRDVVEKVKYTNNNP